MAKEINPIAVDGDKDCNVQDGTKFERPVGSHIVVDGDTYALLGDVYKSGKETGHAKAEAIYALNNGTPLIPGALVKIQ